MAWKSSPVLTTKYVFWKPNQSSRMERKQTNQGKLIHLLEYLLAMVQKWQIHKHGTSVSGKVINDIKSSPLDSQIRTLGTREVKHLAKGHTTGKGQAKTQI